MSSAAIPSVARTKLDEMKIEQQSSNDRPSSEFASHSPTESNASVAPGEEEIQDGESNSNSPEIIEHFTPPTTKNVSSTTPRFYSHYIFFPRSDTMAHLARGLEEAGALLIGRDLLSGRQFYHTY